MNQKKLFSVLVLITLLLSTSSVSAQDKLVAHRGSYVGNAQNSRASLHDAQELGLYGSETDVWLTTDGHIMINHDEEYNGVVIKEATSDECKALILANGEHMPELQDFLDMLKESDSPTRLFIEIKDHEDEALNKAVADAVVQMVSDYGVKDKVEYCSFCAEICDEILRQEPTAIVAYIRGNLTKDRLTPAEIHSRGYTGMTYELGVFREHPEWVKEAKEVGITSHVWSINSPEDMEEVRALGVDFITSDKPREALTW